MTAFFSDVAPTMEPAIACRAYLTRRLFDRGIAEEFCQSAPPRRKANRAGTSCLTRSIPAGADP